MCSYGKIGKILDFGVNAASMGSNAHTCVTTTQNNGCIPNNQALISNINSLTG